MERYDKPAYYCSELSNRATDNQANNTKTSNNNDNNGNEMSAKQTANHNNNNNNNTEKQLEPSNAAHSENQSSHSGSGDYPYRLVGRLNQADQQQQQQQQHGRPFAQNRITNAGQGQQQALPINSSASNSQPQYLISSNNPHHSTNLTPHHINHSQHNKNNQSSFQNQQQTANYHINSNHHLYQSGFQQQQQLQLQLQSQSQPKPQQQQQQQHPMNIARNPLFQHHKSPSFGDDGNKQLQNSVIFQENNKQHQQQHLANTDLDIQSRQYQGDQATSLTTSQSLTQNEFNRIRRKSDHVSVGLTSEVCLESLNLDVEAMLMNDGQNVNGNQLNTHNQGQMSGKNIDKMLRTKPNHQQQQQPNIADCNPNNNGELVQNAIHQSGPPMTEMIGPNGESLYMVYNRSEDNIYEEIDMRTINRLQAEYPVDTFSLHSDTWKKNNKNTKKFLGASFTRWFSTRKKSSTSQNSDQDESPYIDAKSAKKPHIISLPAKTPDNLNDEKRTRRQIVAAIIDSENSYTNSLYRLIFEYKKPLIGADPPILNTNKIEVIFAYLEPILCIHRIFGFNLSHHMELWDEQEMIGSAFTTQFSKSEVLENYSAFINNFTNAMETARRASKSKAFAQFLQDKSFSSPDRLSFFGSMVKPVQRFPQFILLLSDLLKFTPFDHPDRMPLQQALTQLESLADRLNENKRDAERHFAVKQILKDHLNESDALSQRYLLRQDDTKLLEMDPSTNTILKSKERKLYLLNDMLICVSTPSNRLKFSVPLCGVTVIESITPVITNILANTNFKSLADNPNASPHNYTIERMECERQSLVHDLELMGRISVLVSSLRFQYNGLNPAIPEQICLGIREEIRKKEFHMTLIDRSCLQIRLNSKQHKDTLIVQFKTPEAKRDWLIDVRLTKLALDRANNPGWEYVTDSPPSAYQASLYSIGQRFPLFVRSVAVFKSDQSQLTCALHYYLRQAPFIGENPAGVLWICNVSIGASSLGALATNGPDISLIHSYELSDSHVTCLEQVGSTLWIGLRQNRVIVIDANSPAEWIQFASLDVQSEVTCIKYFGHFVYVGLINGVVAVFDAINFDKPVMIQLSQAPVTCLLPVNDEMFACSMNRIWRMKETNIIDSFTIQNDNIIPLEEELRPYLLAHFGNGLWVSLIDSPIVKLYHAESLKHLVDINVGTSIRRVLNNYNEEFKITVTSMMTTRGLLWIGTNVGIVATLTLPRLQGVPFISGGINLALHRFLGPVSILLNLSAGSEYVPKLSMNARQNQVMEPDLKDEDAEAIRGQYADLMNVNDYISTSRGLGQQAEGQPERVPWEFPNPNLNNKNISEDSGSNASSGAIYQDGISRGIKQVVNNVVVANQQLPPQLAPNQQQAIQSQMVASSQMSAPSFGSDATQQMTDPNHIYDKAQAQSVTYNHGSLDGGPHATDSDQLQKQRRMLSASQNQLASGSRSDYGSQSGKQSNRIYDHPAHLIQQQQQQQIHQSRQALNQIENANMLSNNQVVAPTYGSFTSKASANKTVLVLAGGNGYLRMTQDENNKPFAEHAHCIIWEYKAW